MLASALRKAAPPLFAARRYKRSITMATSQKIYIDPNDTGLWKVKQTAEAANSASELLQQDLEVSEPAKLTVHTTGIKFPADFGA